MNLLQETKFIMKKYGITANKKLGQNFLISGTSIAFNPNIEIILTISPGGLKIKLPIISYLKYHDPQCLFFAYGDLPTEIYTLDGIREATIECLKISYHADEFKKVAFCEILSDLNKFKEFISYALNNVALQSEDEEDNFINKLACKYFGVNYNIVCRDKKFLDPRRQFINFIIKLVHLLSGERIKIITDNMYKKGCFTPYRVNNKKISEKQISSSLYMYCLIKRQRNLLRNIGSSDNRRFFDMETLDFKNPIMKDKDLVI